MIVLQWVTCQPREGSEEKACLPSLLANIFLDHRSLQRLLMRSCKGYKDEALTGMSSEGDNRRRRKALVHLIRSYQLRSLHSAHEWHRHIHLTSRMSAPPMPTKRREAYQDNVERLGLGYPPLESIDRQTAIFGNLNGMPILLKYLDG